METNLSSHKCVVIGFYGGEPLLNFKLIKDALEYLNSLHIQRIRFNYRMTTNGTLLNKYIDFLVENDFRILVSLDGAEYHHSYRIYHNGKNSHAEIMSNIEQIKDKYPLFYETNISFNSVLHNRNSVESIHDYIKSKLNKIPKISPLNNSGIKAEKKIEFTKLYNPYQNSIGTSEKLDALINDRFIEDPSVFSLCTFLRNFNNNQFDYYTSIFSKLTSHSIIQNGTCLPFERKIYITVNNKILACERISQEYVLGKIADNRVVIDFENIANMYDAYFENIYRLCKNCYKTGKCPQCIFQFEKINQHTECLGFQNEQQFSNMLSQIISFLEKHPTLFIKLINDVFIQ